ncbi:MAG: PTS sugar transporter subunit IIA [Planctomycetota bacterium]|jgi:PTS system fructose-specific IIA component/PTS system nitrogen regulatory IIA component
MLFSNFIAENCVLGDLDATEKNEAIEEMVDGLIEAGQLREETRKGVLSALYDREKLGSTGIGNGVGIPHAKHPAAKKVVGLFVRSREGVEFDSMDGKPVHLFFLLISNQDAASSHLETLAYISKHLRDDNFCRFLLNARDRDEIVELLAEADEKSMVKR